MHRALGSPPPSFASSLRSQAALASPIKGEVGPVGGQGSCPELGRHLPLDGGGREGVERDVPVLELPPHPPFGYLAARPNGPRPLTTRGEGHPANITVGPSPLMGEGGRSPDEGGAAGA